MRLYEITTQSFRNLSPGPVIFGGVTLIAGENAQGKTNLLEAVALRCWQRSFRGARPADMELVLAGTAVRRRRREALDRWLGVFRALAREAGPEYAAISVDYAAGGETEEDLRMSLRTAAAGRTPARLDARRAAPGRPRLDMAALGWSPGREAPCRERLSTKR